MNQHEPNPRTSTRPIAALLAAALVLTLAACGGGGGGGGGADTGTLAVTVTGLPAGTNANVAVSGPASFSDALTGSKTQAVAVGSYTIAAQPVAAPTPTGATYDPVVPSQSAAVVAATTTDVTVEYDLHECVMYEPSEAGGDIGGTWSASGAAGDVLRTITTPDDPGGGFVTVRVVSVAGIRPQLDVRVIPEVPATASIFNESTSPTLNPDPTLLEMVFEVAPERSYQLRIRAASADSSVSFPSDFVATWSFTSRVDCYEPNDTLATAKAIPMENPITASHIAGFRDSNSLQATSEPTLDFYRFELHTSTAVRITLSDVVATVRPRLTLYNAAGTTVGSAASAPAAGQNAVLASGTLPAGWYRVRVDIGQSPSTFSREAHTSRSNETIPPHFQQDYTLVVESLD